MVILVNDQHSLFPKPLGRRRSDRLQVQIRIGDVNRQNAVRPEVAKVDLECFKGKKVNRNGVAGESVHRQNIKLLRRLVFQRQTRVAGLDGGPGF